MAFSSSTKVVMSVASIIQFSFGLWDGVLCAARAESSCSASQGVGGVFCLSKCLCPDVHLLRRGRWAGHSACLDLDLDKTWTNWTSPLLANLGSCLLGSTWAGSRCHGS